MNGVLQPAIPESTLSGERFALLVRLTDSLPPADLYWISAYSASLAMQATRLPAHQGLAPVAGSLPLSADESVERLSIVYGSQTGNSRRVAEQLAADATAAGLSVRLLRAGAYPLRELAQERYLSVVISS
ncbi:MAG: flavodoxin domain-containing protein, partial [Rhodanobacter sp.]